MTSAIGDESKFLRDAPAEIRDVLDWNDAGQTQRAPTKMTEFAENFLGAMCDDGAAIPETLVGSAPQALALVLLHHLRNPESAGAWLNLGLALRRMALYRTQDSEQVNQRRLYCAVEALERSLQLEPDNNGKNIRAWIGEALTYHQLGLFDDQVRCCSRALAARGSDPWLWLYYAHALEAAGRKREALSIINEAYEAYLMAGQPDELRDVFACVQEGAPEAMRTIH